jgi:hypothetical protein
MAIPVINEEQLPGDHTPKGGVLTILALLFTVHPIITLWEEPDAPHIPKILGSAR